ncbi:FtsW/RodA/SpoVE family cell cycle protein [Microbacterium oryzae]|uniref:FtsW/RodA/SpoVE family cell cycle protein n=1 Tax=Microbacterium oryzae TaxID=743009 RepID=A0A6I6EAD8_9MICO|nr:FtsW/RodA/SpoVE family cell cycle protein [Microbacterium oryzae]QGU28098.1 FtsW/RodA/SpoVE family cell cycle protein [Microbacterium oryzae]
MTAADTQIHKALRRVRRPQPLRNRELLLLLFALAVSAGAVVLVQFGAIGELRPGVLIGLGVVGALTLVLHIVMRIQASQADPFLLPIATLLTGLGIAMIYRIDIQNDSDGLYATAYQNQIAYAAVSIVLAILLVWLLGNYRVLFRYTYIFGLTGIVLLMLPFVPFLHGGGNADVWINIFGFNFQPGELAKICLAIFFAGYLVRTRESLASTGRKILGFSFPRAREFGPLIVVWLISMAIIVFQRDLGTGLLIFGMFVATLYVATGKTGWMLIGVILAVGGAIGASFVLSYVRGRFENWLHAFDQSVIQADGGSFQLVNGIFGLAHGGLFGTGLGQGRPYLTPVSQSDYIFPSLGEEIGLVGLFAVLCLYLVFTARGLRIGVLGQDDFGKLLATALSFTLALQVFIMVGGVTRVIPLTGLTTPFLASGGSSLLANWLIVALILRISDAVRQQPRAVIG